MPNTLAQLVFVVIGFPDAQVFSSTVSVRARQLERKAGTPEHRLHGKYGGYELQGGDLANSTLALTAAQAIAALGQASSSAPACMSEAAKNLIKTLD